MPQRSYAHFIADWERTLLAIEANEADQAVVGDLKPELAKTLEEMKAAIAKQNMTLKEYRVTTRAVQGLLKRGQDLSNRMRYGIRMKYGLLSDELLAYGLQPRRPQQVKSKKRKEEEEEEKKKPAPAVQPEPAPETTKQP